MKYLKVLVMMQLKDKLDFGFTKTRQKLISKTVLTILRFVIVAALSFGFFYVSSLLKIFSQSGGVPSKVLVVIYGIIFLLSVLSCTAGLMKNLYFSEDNKVLITFPVNDNLIFLSRLIIYYIFELKRSLFLTVPIFLGFCLQARMAFLYYIWTVVAFVFISAVPVVIGALLSIPAMYIYRFLRRIPLILILLYAAFAALIVFATVKIIGILPENIDFVQQLGDLQQLMQGIMTWWDRYLYPVNLMVHMVMGYFNARHDLLNPHVILYFLGLIAFVLLVGTGVFLLAKPIFFRMMSAQFEFEKKIGIDFKPNRKRPRFIAFLNTEIKDFLRSDLVRSFLSVYITVPVLIYLINKIFCAIDTRTAGKLMVYGFNLLLILLPVLASDALVATMYSRGGRAAYVTKTMPLNPIFPLTVKLIPVLIGSALSVAASVYVFSTLAKPIEVENVEFTIALSPHHTLFLALGCIFLTWGHIFWSATIDLMNPKNEQYATTGVMTDNPNEQKATVLAFVIAAVFAFFAYVLFEDPYNTAMLRATCKLMLIGLGFLCACVYMYAVNIKIYYSEK